MCRRPCIFFIAVIALLATRLCPPAGAAPFKAGEKLHYTVYLGEIPAGEMVFSVNPMTTVNGIPAYHFVMTARTSPVLDALFMLADRVDSHADSSMTHALFYKEHDGSAADTDITVTYDWKKRRAQYCHGKKKFRPTALMPGAFDPLSVLYALRLVDLAGKKEVAQPVSDGLSCNVARARVLGKQKVRVGSCTYDTYVVQPLLAEFSDMFKSLSAATMKLWIGADARRLPVKFVCEFPIGSILAELTAVESG